MTTMQQRRAVLHSQIISKTAVGNHGRTDNQPNFAYYYVVTLLTLAAVILTFTVL